MKRLRKAGFFGGQPIIFQQHITLRLDSETLLVAVTENVSNDGISFHEKATIQVPLEQLHAFLELYPIPRTAEGEVKRAPRHLPYMASPSSDLGKMQ